MPTLVDAAELELKSKSQEYLDKIGATYVYNVKTRSIYCETNLIDLGVGQLVSIYSPAIGLITSRVRGYTKQLYNKYECEYIVGNYSKYSRLKELENLAKSEEPDVVKSDLDRIKEELKNSSTTFFSKPRVYKKGDKWILLEATVLNGVSYEKGQILQAVYATGKDSDWRLVQLEDEAKTTDGINLVRNYDLRYGLTHWGGVGEIGELTEVDVIPTEFYVKQTNVIGDEYGYEYAITTDDEELIIFDE